MAETPTPAPVVPAVTMKAHEALEARVAQLEAELKDAKLEIARLKVAPAPAPTKKAGILRERS